VHFLRIDLTEAAAQALKRGAALSVGADHPEYRASMTLPSEVRDALVKDLA
jgi:glycerol-3-phosphate dehydrogenase subunit C